jgi:hypothetical protein
MQKGSRSVFRHFLSASHGHCRVSVCAEAAEWSAGAAAALAAERRQGGRLIVDRGYVVALPSRPFAVSERCLRVTRVPRSGSEETVGLFESVSNWAYARAVTTSRPLRIHRTHSAWRHLFGGQQDSSRTFANAASERPGLLMQGVGYWFIFFWDYCLSNRMSSCGRRQSSLWTR